MSCREASNISLDIFLQSGKEVALVALNFDVVEQDFIERDFPFSKSTVKSSVQLMAIRLGKAKMMKFQCLQIGKRAAIGIVWMWIASRQCFTE